MKHKSIRRSHQKQAKIQKKNVQASDNEAKPKSHQKYINGFGLTISKHEKFQIFKNFGSRVWFYCKKIFEVLVVCFLEWIPISTLSMSFQNVIDLTGEGKINKGTYLFQLGILLLWGLIIAAIAGASFYWVVHFDWGYTHAQEKKKAKAIHYYDINSKYNLYLKKGFIHAKSKKSAEK